jgi:hypothetical protein
MCNRRMSIIDEQCFRTVESKNNSRYRALISSLVTTLAADH